MARKMENLYEGRKDTALFKRILEESVWVDSAHRGTVNLYHHKAGYTLVVIEKEDSDGRTGEVSVNAYGENVVQLRQSLEHPEQSQPLCKLETISNALGNQAQFHSALYDELISRSSKPLIVEEWPRGPCTATVQFMRRFYFGQPHKEQPPQRFVG
jgi:hypothetical protein